MVWLWSTFEEYKECVQPVAVDRVAQFRRSHQQTWFEGQSTLHNSVEELEDRNEELRSLIFVPGSNEELTEDPAILGTAHRVIAEIVFAGEILLLNHRRLAIDRAAYGFVTQHDILEHWEGSCSTKTIYREIAQFTDDIDALISGFRELHDDDGSFLLDGLDLPPDLLADFRTARNLFSVGFEEAGVLLAGRGLEGVLRRIALARKLTLRSKGKDTPASEADLHDLIELTYRIQWKVSGRRLISAETRALLHFLRTLRNSGAHAPSGERTPTFNPRETATLVATVAGHLWNEVSSTRARLTPTSVEKNW